MNDVSNLLEKYPSPKPKNKGYTRYWNTFIKDIWERDNLKQSHLIQLDILCNLCMEYEELLDILDLEGRTYVAGMNNIKVRPEVAMMKNCVTEIRNYSKMLDLVLVKDTKMTKEQEEEKNEFD